jgi:TonB family protein
MRCHTLAISLGVFLGTLSLAPIHAQVPQNTDYEKELQYARSLLADTTATDIPHHVHYDLKLYDLDGHETTATYDVYRDPLLYDRYEIKAPNYEFTMIRSLRGPSKLVDWLHTTGDKPLRITDFEQAFDMPISAIKRFAQEGQIGKMEPQELEGAPLICANDNDGTAICFNPLVHIFAYAQMFNRTIMYDQWLPIGTHVVPGVIRIYQDKKLLVEATGTVEAVKTFPPHFMQVPDTPSQTDPANMHKILHYEPLDISQMRYGNIAVRISVDEKGKVTKAEVADSDDKHLDGVARKFARKLLMQPEIKDGSPVPYDTVIYLEYYPQP